MLWGDFPWSAPPQKLGKLLSAGVVARNMTRAFNATGHVVPYITPPPDVPPAEHRAALAAFLADIDVLWADLYPGSALALELRHEQNLPCPVLLFAGGVMPKGAEAALFPWQHLLRATDTLLFT